MLRNQDALMRRAVGHLAAEVGLGRFLVAGSGIVDGTMVHTLAQQSIPAARVVYVNDGPAAEAHPGLEGSVGFVTGTVATPG